MPLERVMQVVDKFPGQQRAGQETQIAFATDDLLHVDQHFGTASRYVIYRFCAARVSLFQVAQFEESEDTNNEYRLATRVETLAGCAAVYCEAVGGSAIRQLMARNIRPVRVRPGTSIAGLVAELKLALAKDPPAWLTRPTQGRDPARFEAMSAEGWQE